MASRGRTAVVTGSTSGIGLAIAKGLAAAGYNTVLTGFGDPGEIDSLVADLVRQCDVEAAYSPADVAQPCEIRNFVANAVDRFGPISILINNAGIQYVADLDVFPEEEWDRVLAINLSAAFHTTKAVLPTMKSQGWGRIINIASAHGLVASVGKAAYVASKHGLIGLVHA